MYCAATAPPGLLATLQGLAGSCHYSLGMKSYLHLNNLTVNFI